MKCVCRLPLLQPQILKHTGCKMKKCCGLVGYSSRLICYCNRPESYCLRLVCFTSRLVSYNILNSRTQTLNVSERPGKLTGLWGTFTGGLKLLTVWYILQHSLFVITYRLDHHISDKQDACYRQACFINRQGGKCNRQGVKLTDKPVARWMYLGSVTRVRNSRWFPTSLETTTN